MQELIIGTKAAYKRLKKDKPDPWVFFTEENERSARLYADSDESRQRLYKTIYDELPDEFDHVNSSIGDLRNDINHFGIRKHPFASDKFRDKLILLYKKALDTMKIFAEQKTSKPTMPLSLY